MNDSTKNSDVRANNRKRIVNALFRQGQMTKQELSLKLNISLPTVTSLLKELTEKGLVTHGKILNSTGGRKPVCITPIYNVKYSIGAQVSAKGIHIIMLDLGSNIVAREFHSCIMSTTQAYWKTVNDIIMDFARRNLKHLELLLDIGITLEFPMQDGRIILKEDMPYMDLGLAASCFERPVKFRNSTKMEAIAQTWAEERWENFVFVSLSDHFDGAMVYNGEVLEFSNINGAFGDMLIHKDGTLGRMTDYFTVPALCRKAQVVEIGAFFDGIAQSNATYKALWEEYMDGLCIFLHNIHCIFGWKIVVGGTLSAYMDAFRDNLNVRLAQMNDLLGDMDTYLEISRLGEYGAAVGAAMLPVDEFLEFGYDEI